MNVFGNKYPPNCTKKFIFEKTKFTSLFSLHVFCILKPANALSSLRKYDPLKHYFLKSQEKLPDARLIIPQECPIPTDSGHMDSDCVPTIASQSYPQLPKVFDHPLNDKALKV